MPEIRFTEEERAKHLRKIQQARAIGIIENKVYTPFKAGWTWFMHKDTLRGALFAVGLMLVIGLIGSWDSPEFY